MFSTRLVLFWYQSLVSIFRKIGGEKIRYSFPVSDTWLVLKFQMALMFEYQGRCKGRVPFKSIYIIAEKCEQFNDCFNTKK